MKIEETATIPVATRWIRPIGLGVILFSTAICGLALWWVRDMLLPIYDRLWRQAPVVEVVYPAFAMPAALVAMLMMLLVGLYALLKGRPLTSAGGLWFRAAANLTRFTLILLIALTPLLAIGTTIALKMLDYRTCSELRVSGSAWQVFWVNTDAYCFVPDRFINGNWPCRIEGSKTICLQADGR